MGKYKTEQLNSVFFVLLIDLLNQIRIGDKFVGCDRKEQRKVFFYVRNSLC